MFTIIVMQKAQTMLTEAKTETEAKIENLDLKRKRETDSGITY